MGWLVLLPLQETSNPENPSTPNWDSFTQEVKNGFSNVTSITRKLEPQKSINTQ
ncbi:hypothetical protein LINPERPRIM_LOCUS8302, partial [Linum perenne]